MIADAELPSGREGTFVTSADPVESTSRELVKVQLPPSSLFALDVGIDVAATVTRHAVGATRGLFRAFRPIAGVVGRASAVTGSQQTPESHLNAMAARGSQIRAQRTQEALDLTAYLVPRVVDLVLDQIDINAILARFDMTEIAQQIIDGVDLPAIIRESSTSVASATVLDVRMRGIKADERLSGIVDRVISRRRGRDAIAELPEVSDDAGRSN
jgi:hypothetical protein